jgi:hypothetical protein
MRLANNAAAKHTPIIGTPDLSGVNGEEFTLEACNVAIR